MNYFHKIALLLLLLITAGCEEVVEIDLEESEPRLVIEASLVWNQERSISPLYIKLTTTAPYFDDEVPAATGALVSISDPLGDTYFFEEIEPGLYRHEGFPPLPDNPYELEIIYQDEVFTGTETFVSTPKIEYIEQNNDGGFSGDEIELRAFYTDPAGIDNYYLFQFYHEFLSIQISDDELVDGNRTFAFFSDEDLAPGDEVFLEIQGISERFYEYMFILRSQAGTSGGPFQTQPTTVRGNIINNTNPDNYPFGFFRLSESHFVSYQIE